MTSSPARFPDVLHRILMDAAGNVDARNIISWLPCGRKFKIHNSKLFAAVLMPKYFSHTSFKTFLRQLSLYEFKRSSRRSHCGPPARGSSYQHPYFQRDRPNLLSGVVRVKNRKTTKSVWSSYSAMIEGDATTARSSSSGNSRHARTNLSADKYLDPSTIVGAENFSWDILDEIVQTFAPYDRSSNDESSGDGQSRRRE